MKVKELMNRTFVTIPHNTPVKTIFNVFLKQNATILPVFENEKLIGFIHDEILITRIENHFKSKEHEHVHTHMNPEKFIESQKRLHGSLAKDLIDKNTVTMDENEDILDAIKLMIKHSFHCIPIIRKDKVVGILSRYEALKASYYFEELKKIESDVLTDEEITYKVYSALKDHLGISISFLKVRTYKGEVHIQGAISTQTDYELA